MTWFLIRNTVIFTCVIILLFDTVQILASDTKPIQYDELMTIKLELTKIIGALPSNVAKVFGCNFLYHALLHVKLSHKLTADSLVKYSNHEWSKKMLVYILLSIHTKSMRVPLWAFCLYTYKMKSGESIESSYEETFNILRDKLKNDCPILDHPDNDNYPMNYIKYMTIVTEEYPRLTLTANVQASHVFFMEEKIPTIKTLAETFADNISIDRLFLNHVLGDPKFSKILIDKSGLVPTDNLFITYLIQDNLKISNTKTPLYDRLYKLLNVYYHLSTMLKIMMLRFCSYHLRQVKYVKCVGCLRVHRSKCNSKISGNLKKFAQLLWLADDDPLMPLFEQFDSETNGDIETIERLQADVLNELSVICDQWKLNDDYRETISMKLPTAKKLLRDLEITNEIAVDMKTKCANCKNVLVCHGIELTNLYADVFVGFLEKTLTVNGYFLYDGLLILV